MTDQALRRTSLYDCHVRAHARLIPFVGWEMPVQYEGVVPEHRAVRSAAGMFDVTHMGELELKGPEAEAVVNHTITGDATKLVEGQAVYTCACNEGGTILDDLIVYKRKTSHYVVVCNASNVAKMSGVFARAAAHKCDFEDISDNTALVALQGPKAYQILALAGGDGPTLHTLGSFHFRDAVIGKVKCTVARTGYTGEDGCEIFTAPGDAPELWDRLLKVGGPLGLVPAGLGARDTLRLEARLSLYGNDIDETTNPLEAGLAWIVKMDKPDFVGRRALEAIKARPFPRRIAGFEVTGRGIARHGYALEDMEGKVVGICTSGSPGPWIGKNIGLGYLPTAMTALGTKFQVDCRGKPVEAVVVKTPFYKRAQ